MKNGKLLCIDNTINFLHQEVFSMSFFDIVFILNNFIDTSGKLWLRLQKIKSDSKKPDVWDSLSFVAFFGCKKGFTSLEAFSSSLGTAREYFRPWAFQAYFCFEISWQSWFRKILTSVTSIVKALNYAISKTQLSHLLEICSGIVLASTTARVWYNTLLIGANNNM